MANLLVRNVDDTLVQSLREQAARAPAAAPASVR
ncbi:FitA-like ribbon-helix-helix domain-containing protein, partial [Burkholderia cenocepacia]